MAVVCVLLAGAPAERAAAGTIPADTGVASILIFDASFNFLVNTARGFTVAGRGAAPIDMLAPFAGTISVAFDPDPMVSYELYLENHTGGPIEGALVIEIPIVQSSGGASAYSRLDAHAVEPGGSVGLESQHLPILVDLQASPTQQDTFLTTLVLTSNTASQTLVRQTAGPRTVPAAPTGHYDRFAVQLSFSLAAGDTGRFGGSASFPTPVGACDDFLDNDGDGRADHAGGDGGCDSSWDSTERRYDAPCDDGFDDDGDGWIDAAWDPGCRDADSTTESPQCQDGLDNDGDGRIDFDGGASARVPGPQQTAPDPHCTSGGVPVGWLDLEQGAATTTTTTTSTTAAPTTTTTAAPTTTTTSAPTTTTAASTTTTTSAPTTTTTAAPTTTTTAAPPTTTSTTTTLPVDPQVFELRISDPDDDAEERPVGGGVSLGSSDLEMVTDGSIQVVGLRFASVTVPRNATIVAAWIQFQVDEVSVDATNLTIRGQKVADAPPFLTSVGNLSARPDTSAFVAWSPSAWPTVGVQGPAQRTPPLEAVVQEIVSGASWESGNAMVFTIEGSGERVAEAADGDASGAALLHVEYVPRPPRPTVFCGIGPELAPLLSLLGLARLRRARRRG